MNEVRPTTRSVPRMYLPVLSQGLAFRECQINPSLCVYMFFHTTLSL